MTLGEKISARRKELHMTQVELANRLNTTKQTIGKYEHDIISDPPLSRVKEFAKALDCDPKYLTGWAVVDVIEETTEENSGSLTDRETALLDGFRRLNDQGQEKLIDYMNDLLESPKNLKKDNTVPSIA